jgi:ribonuclease Z
MAEAFDCRLVNDPFEDPALYVRLRYRRRALLFDLGTLESLATRELLQISDVFVSHTHIDHFIGFDHLLRCSLNRDEELRIFGPKGIVENVRGKLAGYTWNLVRDYPLSLRVVEVEEGSKRSVRFAAPCAFAPEELGAERCDGTLLEEPGLVVRSAILDHKIPCLAFSLEEQRRYNIRKEALRAMGLSSGPWLDELKRMLRERAPASARLSMPREGGGATELTLAEWRERLVLESPGQKIAYAVDHLFSPENAARLCRLAAGADLFYCEASFADADAARAAERYHLTARQAGRIARAAGVRRFVPFHFSLRYKSEPNRLLEEALEAFAKG